MFISAIITVAVSSLQYDAYKLQSDPAQTAVLYLDFDGHTMLHGKTYFSKDSTVVLEHSGFQSSEIYELWRQVCSDYEPFNFNITTDSTVFLAAPVNMSQRLVITPTDWWNQGSGFALMDCFSADSNVNPGFAFTKDGGVHRRTHRNIAEYVTHELGHTLGLHHDGNSAEPYYLGNGFWAPIMGKGADGTLVTFSNGDYNDANQQEDDLAIIAANPGVGFRPDKHGESFATATPLNISSRGVVEPSINNGIITTAADKDAFVFTTTGGTISITASPSSPYTNLNVELSLRTSDGTVIVTDNQDGILSATVNKTLTAGSYMLIVDGAGEAGSYSDYGSVGNYSLSGTIEGADQGDAPIITVTSPAYGSADLYWESGIPMLISTAVTDEDGSVESVSISIDGVELAISNDGNSYAVQWTPAEYGVYDLLISAADDEGNRAAVSTEITLRNPALSAVDNASIRPLSWTRTDKVLKKDSTGTWYKADTVTVTNFTGGVPDSSFAKLLDNDTSTFWSSGFTIMSGPHSFEFVLDCNKSTWISGFSLWENIDVVFAKPREIELYISDDTTNWGSPVYSVIYDSTSQTGSWLEAIPYQEHHFTPVMGQYVRAVIPATYNETSWIDLSEFQLFRSNSSDNNTPSVEIVSGMDNVVVQVSEEISLSATDTDGSVNSVSLSVNGVVHDAVSQGGSDYSVTWNPTEEGTYQLIAYAQDNNGALAFSTKTVIVNGGSTAIAATPIPNFGNANGLFVRQTPVPISSSEAGLILNSPVSGSAELVIFDILGAVMDRQSFEFNGSADIRWDLCNSAGVPVGSGSYLAIVTVRGNSGKAQQFKTVIGVQK